MAPQQKERLRALTAEEQGTLERSGRRRAGGTTQVQRATALLAVAPGRASRRRRGARAMPAAARCTALVRRFKRGGWPRWPSRRGAGRSATYDAATRAQVVAMAQRLPDRKRDGTATWSLSTLARAVRREAVPAPEGAHRSRQILRDAGSSYQRTRTWCPTGTAERKRKAGWSGWSIR